MLDSVSGGADRSELLWPRSWAVCPAGSLRPLERRTVSSASLPCTWFHSDGTGVLGITLYWTSPLCQALCLVLQMQSCSWETENLIAKASKYSVIRTFIEVHPHIYRAKRNILIQNGCWGQQKFLRISDYTNLENQLARLGGDSQGKTTAGRGDPVVKEQGISGRQYVI